MQMFKQECRGVEEWRETGNKSIAAALRTDQRGEAHFREANKEGITIVNASANKGMNY